MSDRISGYRPQRESSVEQNRRRETPPPSNRARPASNPQQASSASGEVAQDQGRGVHPGTLEDLNALRSSSQFRQVVQEAGRLGLPHVQHTLSDGRVVVFTRAQLTQAGLWAPPNSTSATSADVPPPRTERSSQGRSDPPGRLGERAPNASSSQQGRSSASVMLGLQGNLRGAWNNPGSYTPQEFDWLRENQQLLQNLNTDSQMRETVYNSRRQVREAEQQTVRMRMITLMLLMGDIVGAVRAMVFESERQSRVFNRILVKQLNKVREAKSKVMKSMAIKSPPLAHPNTGDPVSVANDQNRQQKYTQWVSLSTQLMSEIQQTEREAMDFIGENRRNVNNLLEFLANLTDIEAKGTRAILMRT